MKHFFNIYSTIFNCCPCSLLDGSLFCSGSEKEPTRLSKVRQGDCETAQIFLCGQLVEGELRSFEALPPIHLSCVLPPSLGNCRLKKSVLWLEDWHCFMASCLVLSLHHWTGKVGWFVRSRRRALWWSWLWYYGSWCCVLLGLLTAMIRHKARNLAQLLSLAASDLVLWSFLDSRVTTHKNIRSILHPVCIAEFVLSINEFVLSIFMRHLTHINSKCQTNAYRAWSW